MDPCHKLDGHYFSFKNGSDPKNVVDRFYAKVRGNTITYYRNGNVGQKTPINVDSCKPCESYRVEGKILHGPVRGEIQDNGDIKYSHGYTSRKG
jgi:hypothetical protein